MASCLALVLSVWALLSAAAVAQVSPPNTIRTVPPGTCSVNLLAGQQCGGNFSGVINTCTEFSSCQNTAWTGACCPSGSACAPIGSNVCWGCGGTTPSWLASAQPPSNMCTATAADGDYDYGCVLGASMLFYDAQRSGNLSATTNRIPWRGNAGLADAVGGKSLVGGWYDAGDNDKFIFPFAWSVATLALGLLEFPQSYQQANQTEYALANLKWGADFLAACRYAPTAMVAAILSPAVSSVDGTHAYWNRPEDVTTPGLVYSLTSADPGADLLAAAAAGLAATSAVFQSSDPAYSNSLLAVAQDLYGVAQSSEGLYSDTILVVKGFYQSYSYLDDLAWAAAWLALRTGSAQTLNEAETYFQRHMTDEGGSDELTFDYNNVIQGAGYLLGKLDQANKDTYTQPIRTIMNKWLQGTDGVTYSPQGLAVANNWGTLRYVSNQALMALLHNKLYPASTSQHREQVYACFARKQLRYMLGDNGDSMSYVTGVGGGKSPCQVHHRAASCGPLSVPCDCLAYYSPACNPNAVYGALVSGPGSQDNYTDVRSNYQQTEVAIDFNAGFSGAVAGLLQEPTTWSQCQSAGLSSGRGTVSTSPSAAAMPAWSMAAVILSAAAVLGLALLD